MITSETMARAFLAVGFHPGSLHNAQEQQEASDHLAKSIPDIQQIDVVKLGGTSASFALRLSVSSPSHSNLIPKTIQFMDRTISVYKIQDNVKSKSDREILSKTVPSEVLKHLEDEANVVFGSPLASVDDGDKASVLRKIVVNNLLGSDGHAVRMAFEQCVLSHRGITVESFDFKMSQFDKPVACWQGSATLSSAKEAISLSRTLSSSLEKALGMIVGGGILEVKLWPANWSPEVLEPSGKFIDSNSLDEIHARSVYIGDIDGCLKQSNFESEFLLPFSMFGAIETVSGHIGHALAGGKSHVKVCFINKQDAQTAIAFTSQRTLSPSNPVPIFFDDYLNMCRSKFEKMDKLKHSQALIVPGTVMKSSTDRLPSKDFQAFLKTTLYQDPPLKIQMVPDLPNNSSILLVAVIHFANPITTERAYQRLLTCSHAPTLLVEEEDPGEVVCLVFPSFAPTKIQPKWSCIRQFVSPNAMDFLSLSPKRKRRPSNKVIKDGDCTKAFQTFWEFTFNLGKSAFLEAKYEEAARILWELMPSQPSYLDNQDLNHVYLYLMSVLMSESHFHNTQRLRDAWDFLQRILKGQSFPWFIAHYPRMILAKLNYKFTLKYPYNPKDFEVMTRLKKTILDPVNDLHLPQFSDGVVDETKLLQKTWQAKIEESRVCICTFEDCLKLHEASEECFFHWTRDICLTDLDYQG